MCVLLRCCTAGAADDDDDERQQQRQLQLQVQLQLPQQQALQPVGISQLEFPLAAWTAIAKSNSNWVS